MRWIAQPPTHDVPGAFTLSLLVAPHTVAVLRALDAAGSMSLSELTDRVGAEARELRPLLAKLRRLDSVKRRGSGLATRYSPTPAGSELLDPAASVESMLGRSPGGPNPPGSERARELVDLLIQGKGSGVFDTLMDGPATLDEIGTRVQRR